MHFGINVEYGDKRLNTEYGQVTIYFKLRNSIAFHADHIFLLCFLRLKSFSCLKIDAIRGKNQHKITSSPLPLNNYLIYYVWYMALYSLFTFLFIFLFILNFIKANQYLMHELKRINSKPPKFSVIILTFRNIHGNIKLFFIEMLHCIIDYLI